ncbi:MAG: NAD(P)/FAD-dependent oxidoreductase [Clostridia bacterium]
MKFRAINRIKKALKKAGYTNISVREKLGGVLLEGELEKYADVLACGRLAVEKKHSRGVINKISVAGYQEKPMRSPLINDKAHEGKTPDALIIGGGIVGAAIARELSKYNISVMLVEKEYDLAIAQSSRNDGMIHAGIDLNPNSKKVKYNMRGNALYDTLSKELGVPISKNGQYVLFTSPVQRAVYPFVKKRAGKNHIPCEYLSKKEVSERIKNPGFNHGGMFFAGAGVVSPYLMTVALAENAVVNGAEICFDTAVLGIENDGEKAGKVITNRGAIYPKVVINAAGVYSDKIAEMAGDGHFTIHPRRGVEAILDKKAGHLTHSVIGRFAMKTSTGAKHTKGGGIVYTIDGNILIGPSADETQERENNATTREELDAVINKQRELTPDMKSADIITYFAGTRAATYEEEFIVEKSPIIKNLIQAAGIQSPGITAAPAIAEDVAKFTKEILANEKTVQQKKDFIKTRKPIPSLKELSLQERDALIKERPDYGIIICRCEEISRGEIMDAIKSPVPALTLDGIKRRVRAGMGRCQGGFCAPLITQIIAEETGIDITQIGKKGGAGKTLCGYTKEQKE